MLVVDWHLLPKWAEARAAGMTNNPGVAALAHAMTATPQALMDKLDRILKATETGALKPLMDKLVYLLKANETGAVENPLIKRTPMDGRQTGLW
jgi:hypothetical protein